MDGKDVARQLREIIETMKVQGTAAVDVNALVDYLRRVELNPNSAATIEDQELFRQRQENARTDAKIEHERQSAEYQMINTAGEATGKALFLLNGAAAIAMLAFVGKIATNGTEWAAQFGQPLLGFGWGALAAVGVYGARFLAHFAWGGNRNWQRISGHILNWISIVLGVLSFLLFPPVSLVFACCEYCLRRVGRIALLTPFQFLRDNSREDFN